MVKYHASVHGYRQGPGNLVRYAGVMDEALDGAKEFIKAGYDALHDGDAKTTKAIFERYFGVLTPSKGDCVRGMIDNLHDEGLY